ncbi:hypothetical protein HK100_001533, partial [Physocladia obscura]
MSRSRKQFTLRKTIAVSVSWFIYSAMHSLVVLYDGKSAHMVELLRIGKGQLSEMHGIDLRQIDAFLSRDSRTRSVFRTSAVPVSGGVGGAISRLLGYSG